MTARAAIAHAISKKLREPNKHNIRFNILVLDEEKTPILRIRVSAQLQTAVEVILYKSEVLICSRRLYNNINESIKYEDPKFFDKIQESVCINSKP